MEVTHDQPIIIEPKEMKILKLNSDFISEITSVLKSPTRQKILQMIKKNPMDISELAKELNQTEANISAQIKCLEKAGLIKCSYQPGGHGVRKICEATVDKIIIELE